MTDPEPELVSASNQLETSLNDGNLACDAKLATLGNERTAQSFEQT